MRKETSAYYKQREQQERDLAAAAIDPCAKAAHLELAERYASYNGEDFRLSSKSPERDDRAAISALAASIAEPRTRRDSAIG